MADHQAGWLLDVEDSAPASGGLPLLPPMPPPPGPPLPLPVPSLLQPFEAPAPPLWPTTPGDVVISSSDHPATSRRRLATFVIGAVVVLGAGTYGAMLLATDGTAPLAIQSPTEANSKLYAAAVEVGTFHYVSSSSAEIAGGKVTGTQSGDVGQSEGVQYLTSGVGDYEVIVVGSAAYMSADLATLENVLGYSPSEAAPFVHQWIAFAPSDAPYKAVAANVTTETTWTNSSASPTDGLPQTPVSVTGVFTANGEPVQSVRYVIDGGNAAAGDTYSGSESITFAATDPHLPRVATERLSGTVSQRPTTSSTRTTFSHWGESVSVKAPTTTIAYSTLPQPSTTA